MPPSPRRPASARPAPPPEATRRSKSGAKSGKSSLGGRRTVQPPRRGRGRPGGDASRFDVSLASGDSQNLHLTTERQIRLLDENDPERFAAQTLDWSASTGERSQASVTARLVSQSNAFRQGAVGALFAQASDQMDLYAGYRTDLGDRWSVRLIAAYRHAVAPESGSATEIVRSETRVGAVAGTANVLPPSPSRRGPPAISPTGREASLPSSRSRSIPARDSGSMPRRHAASSSGRTTEHRGRRRARTKRIWPGSAAPSSPGASGTTRRRAPPSSSRRVGATSPESSVSCSIPTSFVRQDSLYFLPGDVATELSSSASGRVGPGIEGRLSARVGRVTGESPSTIGEDYGTWTIASAGLYLLPTGTTLGIGYRVVSQSLVRGELLIRNDLATFDVNLSPVSAGLADPGSRLRLAGSSLPSGSGKRRDGAEEERPKPPSRPGGLPSLSRRCDSRDPRVDPRIRRRRRLKRSRHSPNGLETMV